jgi:type III restriction enzyme
VGATETRNSGIIGEPVDLTLAHEKDVRPSQIVYELTSHLVLTKWRDSHGEVQLNQFHNLKRIAREWINGYLDCKGTSPAQLKYKTIADMACDRITAAIVRSQVKREKAVTVVLDPYNPKGSTRHVNFSTSKTSRWDTVGPPPKSHLNWLIMDSSWESEFCRVAEEHPRVVSYVKNHNLGFEVPYRYGSTLRTYIPDFIVRVNDGSGEDDLLNLIVEIKGYRGEDAKEKKSTMENYWVPGVNHMGGFGRWAFAEFVDVYEMQDKFAQAVQKQFGEMIESLEAQAESHA